MEYVISAFEIHRRKTAYISLSISLVLGTFFASIVFQLPIPTIGYLLFVIMLIVLGLFAFNFFTHIAPMKIILSSQSLQKVTPKWTEEYHLNTIKRIEIKWTTNKTIREIYIRFDHGKNVTITALKNFEKFNRELQTRINDQADIKEIHEPLDFDHPFFYPILGIFISHLSLLTFKSLVHLNHQQLKIGLSAFVVYLVVLGIYFCINKPIANRVRNSNPFSDYLLGTIMIMAGILLVFGFLIPHTLASK